MPLTTRWVSPELLIAYSLLPFITPAKMRSILNCANWPAIPTAEAARMLNITADEAILAKDPLHASEIVSAVRTLKDQSLTLLDNDYPRLLAEIADPPPAIFLRGNRDLLKRPAIAVVGSRNASPYGVNAASWIARGLSEAGVSVVSGLARGVDIAAHRAALHHAGGTAAVLGTGLDLVYPRGHRRTFHEIAARGLIITEFPPGTPPRAPNFPMRNRVISGLTLGTVIVEATDRSGSLITARLAAEQGREVFAVPGPIFSAKSAGCHRLIQYGAKLVHDLTDIYEEIRELSHLSSARAPQEESASDDDILSLFPLHEGVSADDAALRSGRSVQSLAEDLLRLEMDGRLKALPGARYMRVV